jgi:hypothetical protein
MDLKIGSIPSNSSKGSGFGMKAVKCGKKFMIGHTTFKNQTYLKLTKLQPVNEEKMKKKMKPEAKFNSLSIPLMMTNLIISQIQTWMSNSKRLEEDIVKCGRNSKKLMKLSEREKFHIPIEEDEDDGKSDLIVHHKEFEQRGQATVYATMMFIRFDRDKSQALQHPIITLLLSKYPNSEKYEQKVDIQTRNEITLLLNVMEDYIASLEQASRRKPSDDHIVQSMKRKLPDSDSEDNDDDNDLKHQKKKSKPIKSEVQNKKRRVVDEDSTSSSSTDDEDMDMNPSCSSKPTQWGSGSNSHIKPAKEVHATNQQPSKNF